LSPARGSLGAVLPNDGRVGFESVGGEECSPETEDVSMDGKGSEFSESGDDVASEEMVEEEELRSECARVYLTFLISSSSGVRNDTFFSAGNSGRAVVILRGSDDWAGLLRRIEVRLWGCL
jgi:hypothetical protein